MRGEEMLEAGRYSFFTTRYYLDCMVIAGGEDPLPEHTWLLCRIDPGVFLLRCLIHLIHEMHQFFFQLHNFVGSGNIVNTLYLHLPKAVRFKFFFSA